MSVNYVSSHFSGIGPDKLILDGFLAAALRATGLPFASGLKHHLSVDPLQAAV